MDLHVPRLARTLLYAASMKHSIRSQRAWILVTAGLVLGAGGCKGDGAKAAAAAGSADVKPAAAPPVAPPPAAAPAGCGSDYADPQKEFCVPIAAGYTLGPIAPADVFFSEAMKWTGSDGTVEVRVGLPHTYEEIVHDNDFESNHTKDVGKTAGDAGQWWSYPDGGFTRFISAAKSANGHVIQCWAGGGGEAVAPPNAITACKGIRAYPKS